MFAKINKPPMGWNSWDCFGVDVTEQEVRENAEFMARNLKQYGWEYIVIDIDWYSPSATRHNYKQPGIEQLIDDYGRLVPAANKFPSAARGAGFKPLADYIHSLGLKFGIHIMRGIPVQAVDQNTKILGSDERAADVAVKDDVCRWYRGMYGIDMTGGGGRKYYDSIVELYAGWEVDFIKADDFNSWDGEGYQEPYHTDEIEGLAKAIERSGREIVLSLSPGAALTANANHLRRHANMWRISADFWDDWAALKRQFAYCAKWANYAAPHNFPDADMLPIGGIGIRGEVGEPRTTNFTAAEQTTLLTLWCIFRSPLMFGGHLPESDEFALSLITNAEVLAVNQASRRSREIYRDAHAAIWAADSEEDASKYLALFNLSDEQREVEVDLANLRLESASVRDLWKKANLGEFTEKFSVALAPHGAGLYRLER